RMPEPTRDNSLNPLDPSLVSPKSVAFTSGLQRYAITFSGYVLTLRGIEISEITHELTGRRSLPSVLIEFNQEDRDLAFPH
ncbi:MAG: hypothetical protein AAGJ80_01415, partial [Cyanobacteria bacterium J06553_1]